MMPPFLQFLFIAKTQYLFPHSDITLVYLKWLFDTIKFPLTFDIIPPA